MMWKCVAAMRAASIASSGSRGRSAAMMVKAAWPSAACSSAGASGWCGMVSMVARTMTARRMGSRETEAVSVGGGFILSAPWDELLEHTTNMRADKGKIT